MGGEREVLLEGNIEKGEEEDGRVAEEDVANVSIINQIVFSSHTQPSIPQNIVTITELSASKIINYGKQKKITEFSASEIHELRKAKIN